MAQKANESNHSTGSYRSISPTQELRFLDAIMADHELPMTARAVAYHLVRWTNGDEAHRFNGYAWASREKLAERIGRDSGTTITTATNALKARGWIIVKRRPNDTSLIRPNWDKINQTTAEVVFGQQKAPQEHRKTVFPEDQFSVHPEDQKTGPYSADLDSAYHDSANSPNASRRGADVIPFGEKAGRDGRPEYKQPRQEADQTFERLKRMPFRTDWTDPKIELSSRAEGSALVHYRRHLRLGIAAWRVERCAEKFLASCPDDQRPSLAGFLGRYAKLCNDPESEWYVPADGGMCAKDDNRPVNANDNQLPARKASGDCEEPF